MTTFLFIFLLFETITDDILNTEKKNESNILHPGMLIGGARVWAGVLLLAEFSCLLSWKPKMGRVQAKIIDLKAAGHPIYI